MENHPIPQDVTGFKFKLIGSVTVKQFLYLLGFGILTTIAFVLDINFFLRIPLMLFFASIGAALAFLPIEGRPMDVMIANFAKKIPAENRFIYRKRGANLASYAAFAPLKQTATMTQTAQALKNPSQDKRAALISRLRNSSFRPDASEVAALNNIHAYFDDSTGVVPINPVMPVAQLVQNKDKYEAIEAIEKKQPKPKIAEQIEPAPAPKKDILRTGEERAYDVPDITSPPPPMPEKPNPTLSAGFPTLPDIPNVVLGIVRDPRGKTLPNILVEFVDASGLPVRAFKTNALGQFAAATQLSNGVYKVYFEDAQKQHEFAAIDINLNGEIFQPLEITSIDAREKLRRELFGGQAVASS